MKLLLSFVSIVAMILFSSQSLGLGNSKFEQTLYGTSLAVGSKTLKLDEERGPTVAGSYIQLEGVANFNQTFDLGLGLNGFRFKKDPDAVGLEAQGFTLDVVTRFHSPGLRIGKTSINAFVEGRAVLASKIESLEETATEEQSLRLARTTVPLPIENISEVQGAEWGAGLRLFSKKYAVSLRYLRGTERWQSTYVRYSGEDYQLDLNTPVYQQATYSLGFQLWR